MYVPHCATRWQEILPEWCDTGISICKQVCYISLRLYPVPGLQHRFALAQSSRFNVLQWKGWECCQPHPQTPLLITTGRPPCQMPWCVHDIHQKPHWRRWIPERLIRWRVLSFHIIEKYREVRLDSFVLVQVWYEIADIWSIHMCMEKHRLGPADANTNNRDSSSDTRLLTRVIPRLAAQGSNSVHRC